MTITPKDIKGMSAEDLERLQQAWAQSMTNLAALAAPFIDAMRQMAVAALPAMQEAMKPWIEFQKKYEAEQKAAAKALKPPKLGKVCQLPDCGCTGSAHP